jgi:hypothetical protein
VAGSDTDLAWLAGLWDGEGSVGVTTSRSTGNAILIPVIQINMTHRETLEKAKAVFAGRYGCSTNIHTVRPREPDRHRMSYHFAIRRTSHLATIATDMIVYAITKRLHWIALRDLCQERIHRVGLAPTGHLIRGGTAHQRTPYTTRELALAARLRDLNATLNNRSRTRMEAANP